MGATGFIMVLIGCGPGATACEPIATLPVAYASQAACLGARGDILAASAGLGTMIAECRPAASAAARLDAKASPTS